MDEVARSREIHARGPISCFDRTILRRDEKVRGLVIINSRCKFNVRYRHAKMRLRVRHGRAVGIHEHERKVLSIPAAPRGGIENIAGAYRTRSAGIQAGLLPFAAAAVWRPRPA